MRKEILGKAIMVLFGLIVLCGFVGVSSAYAVPVGTGTANDPYQIAGVEDLDWLRTNYSSYRYSHFVQTADIDLTGVNFVPIGDASYSGFAGVYDGGWHTISNMHIVSTYNNYYAGFFMVVANTGTVRNIKFSGVNINIPVRTEYIGTIAGSSAGTLENCYVTSGSIVGSNNTQASGIAGRNGGTIKSCYNTASVSVGTYDARMPAAGGLAADNSGTINNSWNSGNITTTDSSAVIAGGITGMTNANSISYCYSTGTVTTGGGTAKAGGVAGSAFTGNLSSNYYLTGACANGIGMLDNGSASNMGAEPKTDAELKTATTFDGWDPTAVTWSILNGQYPSLLTTAQTPVASDAQGGDAQATVNWQTAKRAGGYRVYWRDTSGSYNDTNVKDALGYAATSTTISGLTNGATYYFVVKATGDGDVLSSASNEVSATPMYVINNLACEAGNARVDFTFSVPAESTSVVLYQSTDGEEYVAADTGALTGASTSAAVTGLINETLYYFKLIVTIGGTDITSNIVRDMPSTALMGPKGYPELDTIPFITNARTRIMIGNDDYRNYGFNPPVTAEYTIYTENSARDTYIYITHDDLYQEVGYSEDEDHAGGKLNFKYVGTLNQGTTYYFAVYDYDVIGAMDLCVSGGGFDPDIPTVSSVTVPAGGSYRTGQNLDFTVNFSQSVTVNTSGGTPYIPITIDTGGTVNASYNSGSGTSALVFRYIVGPGNNDADGIAVGASITANGGTLKNGTGNDAVLTLNSVGSTAGVLVDTTAPTVSSVAVPGNATYISGQDLDFTVNFNEAVTVSTTGGTPYIPITLDTGGTVNAGYVSGSGTSALVFRYTVAAGNSDYDGIAVGGAISANGGTLKDSAGNDAVLTLNSVGNTTGVLVDAIVPAVSSVTVPAGATYIAGQNLDFTVNFSEAVTVNTAGGTPYIPITLDTGGTVNAGYLSGTGTTALIFRYTVVSGDSDANGIAVGSAITANGGTLKDNVGNDATLTLNSVGDTAGVLVDAVAPAVSSVNVPSGGSYRADQNLDFTVNFSEAVTMNTAGGTPYIPITLDTGGTVNASYVSGTGTTVLLFRYTVAAGNSDTNGIAVGSAITANGGTLQDSAGNDATLTLNSVGSTAGVLVDTTVPTVGTVSVPSNGTYCTGQNLDFTVNFSEAVTVNTVGGTPYMQITLDTGGIVNAGYVSGTGTSALVFRYTVAAGNNDADGIAVGVSISANGGTLKDSAGNDANLTLNSIGATDGILVDAIAPAVSSVNVPAAATYVAGQNLDFTVNFGEAVTVNTAGGTPYIPITLDTGGTVNAGYLSGTGTTALIFRYTVVSGDSDTNGIAVGSAITANGGTLKDSVGNDATLTLNSVGDTAGVLVDAVAPAVSSVNVPSGGSYRADQNLDFTVNFSEAVTVNTAGGTPYIPITLDTGGTVNAGYLSGTGTNALLFRYTVAAGNNDADGIAVGAAITANGGTLQDSAGNDAVLTLNSVGGTAGVQVDTTAPTVGSVSVPVSGTYITGDYLNFTVNFSEAVTVNTSGGTPYIPITLDTGGTVNAVYVSGSGTSALVFRYTIEAGNSDTNGIVTGASITANGGTLKDSAGNDATITLNSVDSTAGVLVDAIAPAVSSVNVPAAATYVAGQNLDFTVNFSEAVTVNTSGGTPYIPITLDTGTVNAGYLSGSGTSALVFRYTVVSGNNDADGIAVGASIITNGGTLKDNAGNDAVLTLNNVGTTTGVLVDAIAPAVLSVNVPANDTYVAGENLDFTVNFGEAVTVDTSGGTPYIPITLDTGGTVNASYVSGSGSSALVFRYIVAAGNNDDNGIAVGASITANGGTLKDSAGNDATLTLNNVGSTTGVMVDTTAPTVSSVIAPANVTYIAGQNLDFTVNFSEAVTVNTSGGTPYIPITLDTGTVNAGYLSGSGTSALVFRYIVAAGNNDDNGIAVGASITANGGTLKDSAGNDATLTLNSVDSTAGVLVDAIAPNVSSVNVPAAAIYVAGQNLDFTVNFSEAVTVNTSGGTPYIPITLDTGTVNAGYLSGSGTSALVFRYTVVSGNNDADGITVGTSITPNGGSLKDSAGNDSVLALNNVGSTAGVLADALAPIVTSVTVPAGGSYDSGQDLDFTVNFSENVVVDTTGGTSCLQLTVGATAANAGYVSGSGSSALLFRYTIQPVDRGGVTVGTLQANGAVIKDVAGNDADLTLSNIGDTANISVAEDLTLNSPNGGENWAAGSSQTISWSYTGSPGGAVRIELLKGGVLDQVISYGAYTGSDCNGTYIWPVPSGQAAGSDYTVRVTSILENIYTDTSNSAFTITGLQATAIIISSPNGTETWAAGSSQTISWKYNGRPGDMVKVELLKNGAVIRVINIGAYIGLNGSGSCQWTVPSGLTAGSDYQVRVTSNLNNTYTDTSDGTFTITVPAAAGITLSTPNGGESWAAGSSQTIRWNYSGNIGQTVKVELLKNDALDRVISYSTFIGSSGSGSCQWTAPSGLTAGNIYKVRVTSITNNIYTDTSDNAFTITGPVAPTITVSAPVGGESWAVGSSQTIRWSYTGNPGYMVKIELLKNGILNRVITYGALTGSGGRGTYQWLIPSSLTAGGDYKVRVTSFSNSACTDTSDTVFNIIPKP